MIKSGMIPAIKFGRKWKIPRSVFEKIPTKVAVMENDTPEILAARVLLREHEFLVEVISSIVEGKIPLGSVVSEFTGGYDNA